MSINDVRDKKLVWTHLVKIFYQIFCTLKDGKDDGISFLGLFVAASLPLFFTAIFESRTSDIFCWKKE
jgi:hypothetical protein